MWGISIPTAVMEQPWACSVPCPRQQTTENMHQICNWDPYLVFSSTFLLILNLKPSHDCIFFSSSTAEERVWEMTSWGRKGDLHPAAACLLLPASTCRDFNCWFSISSSQWEVVAVWWPATILWAAKWGTSPDGKALEPLPAGAAQS